MKKVLVVDDSLYMRENLKKILTKNGFQIVGEAENGKEAISKAKVLDIDLITMDITMPILCGISAVKKIHKIAPDIKICMITALGQETMIRDSILAGAKSFLVKPFNEEDVINALSTIFNGTS